MEIEFEKFPSVPRLYRECIITEKIDGTNAQILFDSEGSILCGSRRRIITPDDDNYGFAAWAYERRDELFKLLGEGRHFGEWWGAGIQRRYGMDTKRFSLFNTQRWKGLEKKEIVEGLSVVPVLYKGVFHVDAVDDTMFDLWDTGSKASPGFMNPEGVMLFHIAAQQMFKTTFEHDKDGKPE